MSIAPIPEPRAKYRTTCADAGAQCRRVVISGARLGLGGIRTHLVLLCQLLLKRETEVEVFAVGSNWEEGLLQELRDLGVRFRLPPRIFRTSPRLGFIYACLAWPMKAPRAANSLYCVGAGRSHLFLHHLCRRRAVSINHEIVEPPDASSLAGICARTLDTSVANSRKVAERMRRLWPKKPLSIIPFLTSDGPLTAPIHRKARPSKPLRVIYLGRLVGQKRPDHLVRRWNALSAHPALEGAQLQIHGYDPDGAMVEEMKRCILASGLCERVRIHGEYKTAELPRILGGADMVVLPSLWEGLPLVLVEGMLHGVPFVATAAGGTEELGENNPDVQVTGTDWANFETGLIAMAEKLLKGHIDPVRLHSWAEERYGYNCVSDKWVRCLHQPQQFFQLS